MIGLLIITHETIGEAYRKLAHHFFPGGLPENVRILGVQPTEDQDDIINNAIAALQEFPDNDGVLIMTDIFGATPCNAARRLVRENKSAILTGLNAPMMVKAVQYSPGGGRPCRLYRMCQRGGCKRHFRHHVRARRFGVQAQRRCRLKKRQGRKTF